MLVLLTYIQEVSVRISCGKSPFLSVGISLTKCIDTEYHEEKLSDKNNFRNKKEHYASFLYV
jgi:hypothetical protein